jgi:uncharacterized protein YndB with AHSA1/START domain
MPRETSELRATRRIHASPEAVYDLVTDITRMGEWSPENEGGEWLDAASGPVVGARFRGRNKRTLSWKTTAVVTECRRGAAFTFAVGKHAPERPETTWRYTFTKSGPGCQVTEICEIAREPGRLGRFLTKLATGVSWDDRPLDLVQGMEETLRRLGTVAERYDTAPEASQ